jgi:hypothetical protein
MDTSYHATHQLTTTRGGENARHSLRLFLVLPVAWQGGLWRGTLLGGDVGRGTKQPLY